MNDRYFQFEKLDDNTTELFIYGDIAKPDLIDRWFGIEDPSQVDAFTFKDAIDNVDTPNLVVRINSYGGEVAEGLAIYSLLSDFKGHLITKVDGMACSAAAVVFMAGQERIVPESGLLMIHNAWTSGVSGNANELRKTAEDLDNITKPSINIFTSKTGQEEKIIKELMDNETWLDCNEALQYGFATSISKDELMQSIGDANLYIKKLVLKVKELTKNQNSQINEKDALSSFLNLKK